MWVFLSPCIPHLLPSMVMCGFIYLHVSLTCCPQWSCVGLSISMYPSPAALNGHVWVYLSPCIPHLLPSMVMCGFIYLHVSLTCCPQWSCVGLSISMYASPAALNGRVWVYLSPCVPHLLPPMVMCGFIYLHVSLTCCPQWSCVGLSISMCPSPAAPNGRVWVYLSPRIPHLLPPMVVCGFIYLLVSLICCPQWLCVGLSISMYPSPAALNGHVWVYLSPCITHLLPSMVMCGFIYLHVSLTCCPQWSCVGLSISMYPSPAALNGHVWVYLSPCIPHLLPSMVVCGFIYLHVSLTCCPQWSCVGLSISMYPSPAALNGHVWVYLSPCIPHLLPSMVVCGFIYLHVCLTCCPQWSRVGLSISMYPSPTALNGRVWVYLSPCMPHLLPSMVTCGFIYLHVSLTCCPQWLCVGLSISMYPSPAALNGRVWVYLSPCIPHLLPSMVVCGFIYLRVSLTCCPQWSCVGLSISMYPSPAALNGRVWVYLSPCIPHLLPSMVVCGFIYLLVSLTCCPQWSCVSLSISTYDSPTALNGCVWVYLSPCIPHLLPSMVTCGFIYLHVSLTCCPQWSCVGLSISMYPSPAALNGRVWVTSPSVPHLLPSMVVCGFIYLHVSFTCCPQWSCVGNISVYPSPAALNGRVWVYLSPCIPHLLPSMVVCGFIYLHVSLTCCPQWSRVGLSISMYASPGALNGRVWVYLSPCMPHLLPSMVMCGFIYLHVSLTCCPQWSCVGLSISMYPSPTALNGRVWVYLSPCIPHLLPSMVVCGFIYLHVCLTYCPQWLCVGLSISMYASPAALNGHVWVYLTLCIPHLLPSMVVCR